MQVVEYDIAPDATMFKSLLSAPGTYERSCSELIDNAFDAGATSVEFYFEPKYCQIIDNGTGINDINGALRYGGHVPQHRKKGAAYKILGCYGVGLKQSAMWLGGPTEIITRRRGGSVERVVADWQQMAETGSFSLSSEQYTEADAKGLFDRLPTPTGTCITCRHHGRNASGGRRVMTKDQRAGLVRELSYRFCPAIQSGRQIVISAAGQRFAVPQFRPPALSKIVEADRVVMGLRYRLRAGMVAPNVTNERFGFNIAFGHRVITKTVNGCGGLPAGHFFGWVELLDDGWRRKLSTNKETIEGVDELYDDLYGLCRETLAAASEQSQVVQCKDMSDRVSARLSSADPGKKKAKRNRRRSGDEKTPGAEPTGLGPKHRRASRTQDADEGGIEGDGRQGDEDKPVTGSGFEIHYFAGEKPDALGHAERTADKRCVVNLNTSHSLVKFIQAGNRDDLLAVVAAMLIAHYDTSSSGQMKFLQDEKFDSLSGKWLASLFEERLKIAAAARDVA